MRIVCCSIVILPQFFSQINLSLILRSQIKIYFETRWPQLNIILNSSICSQVFQCFIFRCDGLHAEWSIFWSWCLWRRFIFTVCCQTIQSNDRSRFLFHFSQRNLLNTGGIWFNPLLWVRVSAKQNLWGSPHTLLMALNEFLKQFFRLDQILDLCFITSYYP